MLILLLMSTMLFAEPQELRLELTKVEEDAVKASSKLKAAEFENMAASSRTSASKSQYYPKVTLDGSYKYISQIPSMSIGTNHIVFGDSNNYSIGPSLSYSLLDFGATRNNVKSSYFAEQAKSKEYKAVKQETILAARLNYFTVQLAVEKMRLTLDSLKLAMAQNEDINRRAKAGIASTLDAIASHRQVLQFKLKLSQAQADLASELISLFSLTGYKEYSERLTPVESSFAKDLPKDFEKPDLILTLDSLDATLEENNKHIKTAGDPINPRIDLLENLSQSSLYSSKSISSDHWPKLTLMGRISRDYPNGPIANPITQSMAGISFTMPIFEAGKTSNLSEQKEYESQALSEQKKQLETDLRRDLQKANTELKILFTQKEIVNNGAEESEKISDLTYKSYKAGSTNFLEVQSRNLETLEWKVQLVMIKTQLLMKIAVIKNLSEEN